MTTAHPSDALALLDQLDAEASRPHPTVNASYVRSMSKSIRDALADPPSYVTIDDLPAAGHWELDADGFVQFTASGEVRVEDGEQLYTYSQIAQNLTVPAPGPAEPAALKALLTRFERDANRFGELWERCQGKGWPDRESREFHAIRDDRMPAMRRQILFALAAPAPSAAEPVATLRRISEYAEHLESAGLDAVAVRGLLLALNVEADAAQSAAPVAEPVSPMSNFDAVQRAITLAEMMGGSIAMGYAHRHEVQAYKSALREHLRTYLPPHPAISGDEGAKDAARYQWLLAR